MFFLISIDFFNLKRLELSNELVTGCPDRCLGSIVHTQLVKDMDDVTFYGVRTDGQGFRDFSIGGAFRHQPEYFYLAACEIGLNAGIVFHRGNPDVL